MSGHTIILVQYSTSYATRSYLEFPTVREAMDALVKMYEHKLKELNPQVDHITYGINDLYNYIDNINDICALVNEQSNSTAYIPRDRNWLKSKIFNHLQKSSN
mmetsp:Transcript_31022/g.29627  ORF Transcript_31022/g.29627 Transcript_31022/m.29627 type:complete len:103 (+) Transcript_31022:91-399(+)